MTDYQEIIEKNLSQYMPSFAVSALNEGEQYVDKAPEVKGYFKFISIKYMKRVRDIKKMCIEYINTFIDGCLNLAKNMDDVKLSEAQDTLAKDLNFEAVGASTHDESKQADTKSGVLFLTGDKALKDKLDAIVAKIKTRAKKSEQLAEWADLMLIQSKIQATDIVYDKTVEMLKDENIKKEQTKKKEETEKKLKEENNKLQNDLRESQKALDEYINKYGEVTQKYEDLQKLIKQTQGVSPDDLDKSPIAEDNKPSEDGKLNELRNEFYNENNSQKEVEEINKTINDAKENNNVNDITEAEWNYLFACDAVDKSVAGTEFTAAPSDIYLAMANTKEALDLLKQSGNDKLINGCPELNTYKIKDFNEARIKPVLDMFIKDKAFPIHVAFLFTRLFSENKSLLKDQDKGSANEGKHINVMTSSQFVTEEMIQNTMDIKNANIAIMDILSDCEGGCLYIGNMPEIIEADYVMLDGDGGWSFYKERGDLNKAIKTGEPQNVEPVSFNDDYTLSILNTIFDKVGEDILSKLD